MKYCSHCGQTLTLRIPEADDRKRHVCDGCGHVHYVNPLTVVVALPCYEDKVLLCKRAIEPRHGLWTLPGGFMELGESTPEAAIRETLEEAGARIDGLDLYAIYHVIHVDQVHLFYRARLRDLDFAAGTESLEVRLFREDEIPWQEMAFLAVTETLCHYFRDRPSGRFPLRLADIRVDANNSRTVTYHVPGAAP